MPVALCAAKGDINAPLIEHFDPARMTLPEIEARQAKNSKLAAWHRREEEWKPEMILGPTFLPLKAATSKPWTKARRYERKRTSWKNSARTRTTGERSNGSSAKPWLAN